MTSNSSLKNGLYDKDGNELLCPRSYIIPSGGIYNKMYCCDYSAMELRGQAHYTMKLFGGDLNLCRAYIPYKCYCYNKNGEKTEYDNNNELHRKFFKKYDWYHDENNEKWSPVDLHTQTTINAFGADIVNHKDFKHYRKYGKVCNFAKGVCYNAQNTLYCV